MLSIRLGHLKYVAAVASFVVAVQVSLSQPSGARFRLVEDLRIRADDHEFSRLSHIFVGPHDVLAVPVKSKNRLVLFDSSGHQFGSVGGKGEGPGEFSSVLGVLVGWKQDTMWAADGWLRRVSYFAPNVKLLRTVTNARVDRITLPDGRTSAPGLGSYGIVAIAPNGTILAHWNQQPQNVLQREYGPESYLVHLAPGNSAHGFLKLPSPGDTSLLMAVGGYTSPLPFTRSPEVVTSAMGDRVAYLVSHKPSKDSGSFTVSLFKANGDTVFVKRFAHRGVPIEQSARDSAILALARPGEGSSEVIKQLQRIAQRKMPSIYSEAMSIVIGQDNTVWIGQRKTTTGQSVLVLDNTGAVLGHVVVPVGSQLRRANRTHVWLTEDTAEGESNVVRYRVIGLACAKAPC